MSDVRAQCLCSPVIVLPSDEESNLQIYLWHAADAQRLKKCDAEVGGNDGA